MLGAALDQFGLFGLLLAILGHLAYQVYRDQRGAVADLRGQIDELHQRLDGVGVVLYRQANEAWDDVDEDAVRDMMFNGHEVTFPSDFDEDEYIPPDDRDNT